jgi:tellurite resistance protein TerC
VQTLTQEGYIAFTANAFAVMGLRQTFFLLDGLPDLPLLGSRRCAGVHRRQADPARWARVRSAASRRQHTVSLMIIVVTLLVTVVASLAKVRRNPEVYATHDVTGRHHPPRGAELEHLREVGQHSERGPVANPPSTDDGTS